MNRKVIQVYNTNHTIDNPSRMELLAWINWRLSSKFHLVDELCTGAAYCQLMDMLFPHSVALHRVKFMTNVENDFLMNFKILQASFEKIGVKQAVPVEKLTQGRFQDNLQFLQWFKKFYDANCECVSEDYNARAVRKGVPMGFGPDIYTRRTKNNIYYRTRPKTNSWAEESVGSQASTKILGYRITNINSPVSPRLSEDFEISNSSGIEKMDPEICIPNKPLEIESTQSDHGVCSKDCQKKVDDLNEEIQKLSEKVKSMNEQLSNSKETIDFYRSKCCYIETLCQALDESGSNLSLKQISKICATENGSRE
ncbi:hypothetical protein KR038_002342 [Drosophila bunnanda]|nr:hypothetical protein KR038_002342 [Drosophila bunnanda]